MMGTAVVSFPAADRRGRTALFLGETFWTWGLSWMGFRLHFLAQPPVVEGWTVALGVLAGFLAVVLTRHPTRTRGWAPLGESILSAGFLAAALLGPGAASLFLILAGGTQAISALAAMAMFDGGRRHLARLGGHVLALAAGILLAEYWLVLLVDSLGMTGTFLVLLFFGLAVCSLAWVLHLRDGLELLLSILVVPVYRIRRHGPGARAIPRSGPLLVIANHGAYADPFWLGKIIPRRITPMMSSRFYDLPVIHWLMRRVVRTIRVQESRYRQHAPELMEAIARLDQGECVVLFPEGWVRRRSDQLLRRFGQGVWRILKERPATPVLACWIEGGWQSFTSYWNGPPCRGKRIDWLRRIDIAVAQAEPVPADVLSNMNRTRQWLMERVVALRRCLPECEGPSPDRVQITSAMVMGDEEETPAGSST